MPGPATAIEARPVLDAGNAFASTSSGPIRVADFRPATVFTPEEHDAALAELARRAGPATEGVVVRVNESFGGVRAELNALAGGQASNRVMLLAHQAQRAQLAVELQAQVSAVEHGRFAGGDDKPKVTEALSKGLRNMVGMCAFAADLLNKAHAAATEEGAGKKPDATAQLLTAIGVGSSELDSRSPVDPPGGVAKGPPTPSIPPLSQQTESE